MYINRYQVCTTTVLLYYRYCCTTVLLFSVIACETEIQKYTAYVCRYGHVGTYVARYEISSTHVHTLFLQPTERSS